MPRSLRYDLRRWIKSSGVFVPPTADATPAPQQPLPRLTILLPVFNDWTVADMLVSKIDAVLAEQGVSGEILFVNDASTDSVPAHFPSHPPRHLEKVQILNLKRNLGHQRALATGLVHLQRGALEGDVVVMDADGEDDPSDIPILLKEFVLQGARKIVFAERKRRKEGPLFTLFYQLYRATHRLLVGSDIRVGNFSVLPAAALEPLVVSSDLWNHYAAAVVKMKLPSASVPVNRAKRLAGQSKMGFTGLVIHGLSAISVFGDTVGVRLLTASGTLALLTVLLMVVAVVVKFATHLAIPGWATNVVGLLLLMLCQAITMALILTFVVLYNRGQSSFVPLRDCPVYEGTVTTVFAKT